MGIDREYEKYKKEIEETNRRSEKEINPISKRKFRELKKKGII